jgi:primosomal protein N' (replication factor Y)
VAQVVRVLPDVSGLEKTFDYSVPSDWRARAVVGALVRVELAGRRVGGWIVECDPLDLPPDVKLKDLAKISSVGPDTSVVELGQWAAHRWSGRWSRILKTASPDAMVSKLASAPEPRSPKVAASSLAAEAFSQPGVTLVRIAPAADLSQFVIGAAHLGNALVITPSVRMAQDASAALRRAGGVSRLLPRDWAAAASGGGTVIGARSSVWGPCPDLAAVLVLDEHDEGLQEERNPTWHARHVAIERARRANVACVLVSPTPSVDASSLADRTLTPSRTDERSGWPITMVADRRDEDPVRAGLFSPQLVDTIHAGGKVLCILNRKGRAKMLACASCGELVRTSDGQHLMAETDGQLVASNGETRPLICAVCTGTKLKRLRLGVSRAREELEALAREPVAEISGDKVSADAFAARIVVGTEAALHQLDSAGTVVFLDFDSELMAPRYRAAEQALAMLARAARIVGGRNGGGRILIQTRDPQHRVITAAVKADIESFLTFEQRLRQAGQFPPVTAMAEISGPGAEAAVQPMMARIDTEVLGPNAYGRYLLRSPDPETLATVLTDMRKTTPASSKTRTYRIAVDPPRV